MVLKCPSCSQTFTVPDGVSSGKALCPQCGQRLDIGRVLRPGDLPPGTMLGGCRIEGLLGRGGMAAVYKATQLSLDRAVALKVLPTRLAASPQFVERFNREASALARLSHPNIVGILDKGVEGETYYFVMEYVEGKSVRDRLLRESRVSPQETLQLMQGICAALAYAHGTGIVHRDLKPGNILLDAAGTPKLADFGIARMIGAETHEAGELTGTDSVIGSADYMAPEQREDAAGVDHRADIYSLGVVLYQMLTGQLPVGSFKPVALLVRGVPIGVDKVIRTALSSAPGDRYESVGKFLSALNHAFEDTSVRHVPRAAAGGRAKIPTAAVIVLGALGLAVAGGAIALALSGRHRPRPDGQVSTAIRPTTPIQVVRPKPPIEKKERPPEKLTPPPTEEPPAVRLALASIREHMARQPDDFPTHVDGLKQILLTSSNPQVLVAARKEMDAVSARLDRALADHFAAVRKRADALMDQRAYGAAVRATSVVPPNLFTSDAKKRAEALADEYRTQCWTAFERDRKAAAALVEAGKLTEAVAILSSDYPSAELQKMAKEEVAKLKDALVARQDQIRREQAKLRAELASQLKALWADRRYADGPPLVKAALAKAPDEPSRLALEPHARAADFLDTFWKAVLEALTARKGQYLTLSGEKYTIEDVQGDRVILSLPVGQAKVKREIRKFDAAELYVIARDWLDTAKKPEDNLALALFMTYDSKPDPAGASRAFERAISLGAPSGLVAALRDISSASPAPEVKEPGPKGKEPEPPPAAGFALDLNGASDYVEVNDERRKRSLRLKSFTVEAWVWPRPSPNPAADEVERYVIAKNGLGNNGVSFAIFIKDGCWAYATGDGIEVDPVVTRVPCTPGVWTHCALVYEGGFRTFYVDGKPVGRTRAKRPIGFDDQPLYIGAVSLDGNAACFWRGGIDEVRITNGPRYHKDFTPEREFKADADTHLLLHMDEGKGTRVRDLSRFDNSGALRGGARFLPPGDFKLPPKPVPPVPAPLPKEGPPPAEPAPPPRKAPPGE